MENLQNLAKIDWWYVFLAICLGLFCVKAVWSLWDWFLFEKLGIETKKMKQTREDHELLKITAELAKATAENLNKLQTRHLHDEEEFRNNLSNYMEESRKDRKALHDEMTTFSNNRVSDRKQSLQIQKELSDAQINISDRVKDISNKLDEMQRHTDERFIASEEKENKRVQSEIKERIAQTYREYNTTKKISSMELEALEDLIETYELHGGKNSFVHSVVQKEMYTWEQI